MKRVIIEIPVLDVEKNIEIEVKVNGKRRTICYRVEIVSWETDVYMAKDRVSVLKRMIREYDKDWELIQIGAPVKDNVPIMFRKRLGEESSH